jgi:hypothetical protein
MMALFCIFRRIQQLQLCKFLVFRETNRIQVREANRQNHEDASGRPHAVPHYRIPSRYTWTSQRSAGKMLLPNMLLFVW